MLAAMVAAFFLADYVRESSTAQMLVERFGYLGMLGLSIISGLNLFVPIPAATFTPIYTAAGFPLYGIIITLVVGTTLADSIGYLIGRGGKELVEENYPAIQKRIQRTAEKHSLYIIPGVFLWASFSPLPNETMLIPLALAGVRFRTLILPLLCGNIVHQTLFAYGLSSIFEYFF